MTDYERQINTWMAYANVKKCEGYCTAVADIVKMVAELSAIEKDGAKIGAYTDVSMELMKIWHSATEKDREAFNDYQNTRSV